MGLCELESYRLEHTTRQKGVVVKIASGNLQGNLLFRTCFERCNFGPAKGRSSPTGPSNKTVLVYLGLFCYIHYMKIKQKYPKTGIYEHYKSTPNGRRYYQVIGFAKHTETKEIFAVYIPLYVIPEHKGLRLQVRPLDMFMENVEVDGQNVPRFRYLGHEI